MLYFGSLSHNFPLPPLFQTLVTALLTWQSQRHNAKTKTSLALGLGASLLVPHGYINNVFSQCMQYLLIKRCLFWGGCWTYDYEHEKGNVQYIKKDKIIYKKGWIYLALTHKWLMQSNNKFSYDNSICEINLGEEH